MGSFANATVPPPWFSNGPNPMPASEKSTQAVPVQVPVLPEPDPPPPASGNFSSSTYMVLSAVTLLRPFGKITTVA